MRPTPDVEGLSTLRSTTRGRRRPLLTAARGRALVTELLLHTALLGGATLLVALLEGRHAVAEQAVGVLAFAAGFAASILLGAASWLAGNRRARRLAGALGLYTGVVLLLRTAGLESPMSSWMLASCVAVLGALALLALGMRQARRVLADRSAVLAVVGLTAAALAVTTGAAVVVPGWRPPAWLVSTLDVVAWSGAGAAGLLVLLVGVQSEHALLRRVGLAFVTLSAAHGLRIVQGGRPGDEHGSIGDALVLAAVAMFLVAAVLYFAAALRAVWRHQEATSTRLAQVEATIASVAERDHEMRNLVAGLSGAASVLAGVGVDAPADGRRLLAAAGAEIARLQRMLDDQVTPPSTAAVGTLLHGLVAVHRAGGAVIRIEVEGDPHVDMIAGELAQVVTNLLANCARHAPGAPVTVRVRIRGERVRIEVEDEGPGLPDGLGSAVLRRGVRGSGSVGSGLGLTIVADLVGRNGGAFTLESRRTGCTAVIDLPAARQPAECLGV